MYLNVFSPLPLPPFTHFRVKSLPRASCSYKTHSWSQTKTRDFCLAAERGESSSSNRSSFSVSHLTKKRASPCQDSCLRTVSRYCVFVTWVMQCFLKGLCGARHADGLFPFQQRCPDPSFINYLENFLIWFRPFKFTTSASGPFLQWPLLHVFLCDHCCSFLP